jgi:predicted outer membrane protein
MLRFKEIREASAETKARMKRDLDKAYAAQLKLKYSNAVAAFKELAFDLDNKVQTVDPAVSRYLKDVHKDLKKFGKTFDKLIKRETK